MNDLLSKYGGKEHLGVPDEVKESMRANIEDLVEFQK